MNKEKIKEFDLTASKLGLDGEQMDELRDILRKALTLQKKELLEMIEKPKSWNEWSVERQLGYNQALEDIKKLLT